MYDYEPYLNINQALRFKELGFDWWVERYYIKYEDDLKCFRGSPSDSNSISRQRYNPHKTYASAPSLSLAQRWIRERWGIAINVMAHDGGKYHYELIFLPNATPTLDAWNYNPCPLMDSYDAALSAGIDAALKYLKPITT